MLAILDPALVAMVDLQATSDEKENGCHAVPPGNKQAQRKQHGDRGEVRLFTAGHKSDHVPEDKSADAQVEQASCQQAQAGDDLGHGKKQRVTGDTTPDYAGDEMDFFAA